MCVYSHHNMKHMLPQHCKIYNDVIYWLILQKRNFSQAQCELPEDGRGGPKHVGANTRYFNVNFFLIVQINCKNLANLDSTSLENWWDILQPK
jgi:hypothetical protein